MLVKLSEIELHVNMRYIHHKTDVHPTLLYKKLSPTHTTAVFLKWNNYFHNFFIIKSFLVYAVCHVILLCPLHLHWA